MKVKCKFNTCAYLPEDMIFESSSCKSKQVFSLKIGSEYTIYATTAWDKYVWYAVWEEYSNLLVWRPSPLFELIDNRLSRYWIFSYNKGPYDKIPFPEFVFKEWAEKIFFYDNYIDWYKEEKELFFKYKKLMDLEFPDPSITDIAEIGDDEWLMCSRCIDAWHSPLSIDAMVVCPMCNTVYHNPRFINNSFYSNN